MTDRRRPLLADMSNRNGGGATMPDLAVADRTAGPVVAEPAVGPVLAEPLAGVVAEPAVGPVLAEPLAGVVAEPAVGPVLAEPLAGVALVEPARDEAAPDGSVAALTTTGEPRQPQGPRRHHRLAPAAALPFMGVRVSVVVPALNEAENLPLVFARLPQGLHEVILVDGHSTDGTVETVTRLRPDVRIISQTGHGKGNALAAGFAVCTGDIVVTLDADGSTDPAEIPRFVAALCNGADFVKGSRFAQGGGSSDITRLRRFGNSVLSGIVNRIYGTNYSDLCYGYNAFWRRCLPYIRVDCDGFEVETLINVRIAKAGLVVHEVPSYERSRVFGASNLNAIRDGVRVLSTIGTERIAAVWPRSRLPRIARRLMR